MVTLIKRYIPIRQDPMKTPVLKAHRYFQMHLFSIFNSSFRLEMSMIRQRKITGLTAP